MKGKSSEIFPSALLYIDCHFFSIYTDASNLRKLKAADFTYFTALWWPKAELQELTILAFLNIWLFTWDDEIDTPAGSYNQSFEAAQEYRRETLQFVTQSLGLEENEKVLKPTNPIVRSFQPIGEAIHNSYNISESWSGRL